MIIETYRDYRIRMERQGDGWRAMIRPPGAQYEVPGPSSSDSTGYKIVLVKAKELIDRHAV